MEVGHNAREQLKSVVERIERLEAGIKELQSDRSDIYKEAGGNGFDVPALKAIIRARREDPDKRREREEQIDLYRSTLGMD